jgi:proteasome lid subunit RPN8/RPN11
MRISEALLEEIRQHGEQAYPDECCGVLLGRYSNAENSVTELYPAENVYEEDRQRRYLIPPEEYRDAQREARTKGLEVVGVYHSHPDHPARPSETDLEQATFPGFTYVIVSVTEGTAADVTAWDLAYDRSRFVEDPITT